MEKNKATYQRIVDYSADLMDKHFPKGECKERGKALVFNAELITYVMQELDRAREEGIKTVEEMKYKGDIEKFKHIKTTLDCKTTEEHIWFIRGMTLNDVIARLKSKLTTK